MAVLMFAFGFFLYRGNQAWRSAAEFTARISDCLTMHGEDLTVESFPRRYLTCYDESFVESREPLINSLTMGLCKIPAALTECSLADGQECVEDLAAFESRMENVIEAFTFTWTAYQGEETR